MNSKCEICSRSTREVHVRVAADGDDIYIDLADADWHAVRVTAAGWSIVQSPQVRFRRSAGMQPLPFPARGMSIDRLRPFLNINANDFVLVVAYLRTRHGRNHARARVAELDRSEHGAVEFIAVQWSLICSSPLTTHISSVRKRLEAA